ncbi:MAG: hypothetical protein Ta2E_02640 [Mycoplasmoidaceae bacterium]|nr:MAG: hypothetical protein Ta2E_02640 [Mycoplasmoidaceae bacterium]
MLTKINKIIKKFKENDSQIWEIGTDFYSSWSKIINNTKNIDKTIEFIKTIKVSNNKYKMMIGDINITPCRCKCGTASQSACRQYFQEGAGLGFVYYWRERFWETNVAMSQKFINIHKIKLFDNLLNSLIKSTASPISFVKNLFFSLFLSLLYKSNFDFSKLDTFIITRRTNSKSKNFKIQINRCISSDDSFFSEYIAHIYGERTNNFGQGKRTYITSCEKILENYTIEEIVNNMYAYIIDNDANIEFIKGKNISDEKYNECERYFSLINTERSKLKENIINQRVKSTHWSDLEGSTQNSIDNEEELAMFHACHIKDVWRIKKEIKDIVMTSNNKKLIMNLIYDESSDPNNGILLNPSCHKLFDGEVCSFDSCGKLVYYPDCEQTIIKWFGSNNITIKHDILNEKMKNYFSQRF